MDKDAILTDIVQNGGKENFGLLVNKYKDQLYSFIYYSVKDEGAAGDILQDSFLKAFEHLSEYKYREEGKFKAWLFTIARNKITDHFRSVSKIVQLDEEDVFPSKDNTASAALGNISLKEINDFILRLPREQGEGILLRQYLSFKEIAAVLGCPLGTVLARMSRGLKKLHQFMGEDYAL